LAPRWEPLDPAASRDLAESFAAAGRVTRLAVDAVRRETTAPRRDGQSTPHLDGPVQRREPGLTR
jgi:hypothetical protein